MTHMYLQGNEDGDVMLCCERPECMQYRPGGQDDGPYWFQQALPWKPDPDDVRVVWDAHLATHPKN